MLKAVTRAVSRNITRCELTFRQRESLNYEKAVRQHTSYCALPTRLGAEVHTLELVSKDCRELEVSDISEFRKAEDSLPCLSILFEDASERHSKQNKEGIYAE